MGCDGATTNTGAEGGVITRFEILLRRALQWLICLLHFNELPLRHFTEEIDGKYSGPRDFAGPGKQLFECHNFQS